MCAEDSTWGTVSQNENGPGLGVRYTWLGSSGPNSNFGNGGDISYKKIKLWNEKEMCKWAEHDWFFSGTSFRTKHTTWKRPKRKATRIFIRQRSSLFPAKETNILEKSCGLFYMPLNDTRRKIFSVLSQTQMQSRVPPSSFPCWHLIHSLVREAPSEGGGSGWVDMGHICRLQIVLDQQGSMGL